MSQERKISQDEIRKAARRFHDIAEAEVKAKFEQLWNDRPNGEGKDVEEELEALKPILLMTFHNGYMTAVHSMIEELEKGAIVN